MQWDAHKVRCQCAVGFEIKDVRAKRRKGFENISAGQTQLVYTPSHLHCGSYKFTMWTRICLVHLVHCSLSQCTKQIKGQLRSI